MGFLSNLGKALDEKAEKQKKQEEQARIAKQTEEERLDAIQVAYLNAGYVKRGFGIAGQQIRVSRDISEPNVPISKKKDVYVDIDVCSSETAAENMLSRYLGEGLPTRYLRMGRTVVYIKVFNGSVAGTESNQTKEALEIYTTFMAGINEAAAAAAPAAPAAAAAAPAGPKCTGCGKDVVAGAAFCPSCGCKLGEKVCPQCGKTDNAGGAFCPSCGFRFS